MTAIKPLVLYEDQGLSQIRTGDTLDLYSLGSGTPSTSTFLRGDGSWVGVLTTFNVVPSDGIVATVGSTYTTTTLTLSLGDITPASIASGAISSNVNLSTTAVTITQTGSGNALDVVGKATFSTAIQLNGGASLTQGAFYSSYGTVQTTNTTVVDTFSTLLYRSAKYQIQISDGLNFETLEVFVIHDSINVWLTSYGNVFTASSTLGAFDAIMATNSCSLTYTAHTATNKTIKFIRTTITV